MTLETLDKSNTNTTSDKNSGNLLDIAYTRSQFPFFSTEKSRHWSLFDNAAGTLACGPVVQRLHHFYVNNKVQPYGEDVVSAAAGEQMDAGRATMADLLGVDKQTITIGASTTQNFNSLSLGCTGFLQAGDEIIVSEQDHEANIGGWERAAKYCGAKLTLWKVNENNAELELDDLQKMLNPRVRIIALTHSSNIIGTINPIEQVIEMGHKIGAKVVVDAVSYAPHNWPNFADIGVDAYCFSTYKTYGTHQGIMYVAPEMMAQINPQCHFFNRNSNTYRLDSSGPDHASIAALAGIGDYFDNQYDHHFGKTTTTDEPTLATKARAMSSIMHTHETQLCAKLLEALADLPIKIIGRGTMQGREANIAIRSEKHKSQQLASLLVQRGIATGANHFYAYRLIEKLGIDPEDGVVRLSFAHYNNKEDADKLIAALRDIF